MTRCAETYNKGKMKKGESYEGKKLSYYLKSIFGISIFYPLELSRCEYISPLKTLSKSNPTETKPAYIGSIVTSNKIDEGKGAYRIVEQQPEFPGGIGALYNYLAENVTYPDSARKANIQGKIVAQFYINKDGSLSDITIIKGLGYGCDEEVIRVIKESGNWIPGKQNGKPVRVIMSLPVSFNLCNPSNK